MPFLGFFFKSLSLRQKETELFRLFLKICEVSFMKILLTAFDPFHGETVNAASLAVQKIPNQIEGAKIVKLTVPTVFYRSVETVQMAIEAEQPDAVLCVGQAAGRRELTPERVAINVMDAKFPDNAGNQPVDLPIRKDGPAAYFSTLPIKAITDSMQKMGIPAAVSNTAGTFVCNQLLYGVLDFISVKKLPIRGGFLHVPCTNEQAIAYGQGFPALSLEIMTSGIECALRVIAKSL